MKVLAIEPEMAPPGVFPGVIPTVVGKFDLTPTYFLPVQPPVRENLSVSTRYLNALAAGTRGLNWHNARGRNHPQVSTELVARTMNDATNGRCTVFSAFPSQDYGGRAFYRLAVVNDVHAPRNFSMQKLRPRAPASSNALMYPKLEEVSTEGDLVSRASRGEKLESFRIPSRGDFLPVVVLELRKGYVLRAGATLMMSMRLTSLVMVVTRRIEERH